MWRPTKPNAFYYSGPIEVIVNPVCDLPGNYAAAFYSEVLTTTFYIYFEDSDHGGCALKIFVEMLELKFKTTVDIHLQNSWSVHFEDPTISKILLIFLFHPKSWQRH